MLSDCFADIGADAAALLALDRITPRRGAPAAASIMDPEYPMRRSRNSALSVPLYWRYARASVSPPAGVSTRASVPAESIAMIIGRRTEPQLASDALSTR